MFFKTINYFWCYKCLEVTNALLLVSLIYHSNRDEPSKMKKTDRSEDELSTDQTKGVSKIDRFLNTSPIVST